MNNSSKNRTIAVNAMFLYIRMILLMFISFYTSRVLLQKLGIEDFGIYNIVGGVVAMFASLRGVFASSTQRFFNVALGQNNFVQVNKIFNISLLIHFLICIVFLLFAETIGLWFLCNEISIPDDRFDAALIVFQFSVATSVITIMNVTFDALIIAHEKMKFYSYISLIEGVMKLLVLYLLVVTTYDRLILYSCLLFGISVIVLIIYIAYCHYKLACCRIKFYNDKPLVKEMLIFSGWNFLGNVAYTFVNEGVNFLLNIFGGVILNAARGITYQIRNAIMQFLSNLLTTIQPQAIQSYANNEVDRFFEIIYKSSKYLFCLFVCIALPVFVWLEDILMFWLGIIPDYSLMFIRCILFYLLIRSFHGPIDIYFKAIGKLKIYQTIELITLSLPVLWSYIFLKLQFPAYTAFLSMGIMEFVNLILIIKLIKKDQGDFVSKYLKKVIIPSLRTLLISFLVVYVQYYAIHIHFILEIFFSVILIIGVIFFVGLDFTERLFIIKFLRQKFCR